MNLAAKKAKDWKGEEGETEGPIRRLYSISRVARRLGMISLGCLIAGHLPQPPVFVVALKCGEKKPFNYAGLPKNAQPCPAVTSIHCQENWGSCCKMGSRGWAAILHQSVRPMLSRPEKAPDIMPDHVCEGSGQDRLVNY